MTRFCTVIVIWIFGLVGFLSATPSMGQNADRENCKMFELALIHLEIGDEESAIESLLKALDCPDSVTRKLAEEKLMEIGSFQYKIEGKLDTTFWTVMDALLPVTLVLIVIILFAIKRRWDKRGVVEVSSNGCPDDALDFKDLLRLASIQSQNFSDLKRIVLNDLAATPKPTIRGLSVTPSDVRSNSELGLVELTTKEVIPKYAFLVIAFYRRLCPPKFLISVHCLKKGDEVNYYVELLRRGRLFNDIFLGPRKVNNWNDVQPGKLKSPEALAFHINREIQKLLGA